MEFRPLTKGVGTLIYALDTKRYLFLLRSTGSWSLTWGLPGGKINETETVFEGLNREIEEELGGKIYLPDFVPIEIFTSKNEKFMYHTYFVAVEYEFLPKLNEEHLGYSWLPLTALPRPLHPGVNRTLNNPEIVTKIQAAELSCQS
jgi:8-oxo-dGTP pyrophosphatase MutT (NUDIX family)